MEINKYWIIKHQQRDKYPFDVGVKVLTTVESRQGNIYYYCELVGRGTAVVVSQLNGKVVKHDQALMHNMLYVK